MYEPVEKTSETKRQLVANGVSQRPNSNAPTSRFVDNRPKAIQMRKFNELNTKRQQDAKMRELHTLADANYVGQKHNSELPSNQFMVNQHQNHSTKWNNSTIQRLRAGFVPSGFNPPHGNMLAYGHLKNFGLHMEGQRDFNPAIRDNILHWNILIGTHTGRHYGPHPGARKGPMTD